MQKGYYQDTLVKLEPPCYPLGGWAMAKKNEDDTNGRLTPFSCRLTDDAKQKLDEIQYEMDRRIFGGRGKYSQGDVIEFLPVSPMDPAPGR
jgi:hypothetical protein